MAKEAAGEKKGEGGTNGAGELRFGGNWEEVVHRWERWNREADGVFPPSVERMVERARREHHRPGLFIGKLGQSRR